MARIPLQKIRITGLKVHRKVLLQELHKRGVLEISENKLFQKHSQADADTLIHDELFDSFDMARIDFALDFLAPFAPKKPKLESMLTGGMVILPEAEAHARFEKFSGEVGPIVSECEKLEETFVRNKNELTKLAAQFTELQKYKEYPFSIGESIETECTKTLIFRISATQKNKFFEALAKKTSLFSANPLKTGKKELIMIATVEKEIEKFFLETLQTYTGEVISLGNMFPEYIDSSVEEALGVITTQQKNLETAISDGKARCVELGARTEDLQIAHDFFQWRKTKNEARAKTLETKNIFAFEGWIPAEKYTELTHWLKQVFVGEVIAEKAPLAEGEKTPALLKNKPGIASFQMITEMFGAPSDRDVDPTSTMAPFFVFFFGICLSDVGYGSILTLVSAFFLTFGTFSKEAREKLVMILLCGVSAILGGILLGGWFGMTPEQFPLLANPATGDFYGQILNPLAGNGAMTFLLFTFGVGFVQLLFGVLMDGVRRLKLGDTVGAFADSFAWLYFLIGLALWALAENIGLNKEILQYVALSGAGILVCTQGREKKNIFAKLVFGLLGLYGIMDYVSNMLSYSRLMALGLATGIIGAAMNTTAGVLGELVSVPVLGTAIAIFFVLFGHSLNFALSLLGAFIHSMRLQFIEYFGRFYTGGAPLFKPFARAKKYLLFRG